MTDQEITTIVSEILRDRVPDAGFEGVEARSDFDSDGDSVIRIVARYKQRPNIRPDPLLDSVHAIRNRLIELGDDRFVLLKNDVAEEQGFGEESD